MKRGLALLLLLGGACGETQASDASNHCTTHDECGKGGTCDPLSDSCVSVQASAPYPVVIQLSELGTSAGGLSRYSIATEMVTKSDDKHTLAVPRGVAVHGHVTNPADKDKPQVVAEVSFVPDPEPTGSVVAPALVNSRDSNDSDGNNLQVMLAPDTVYDVTIQPLGPHSLSFPPVRLTHKTHKNTEETFDFAYQGLETFEGSLFDEKQTAQGQGRWVRLRAGAAVEGADPKIAALYTEDQVVSSLGIVRADGTFTVQVLPEVLPVGKKLKRYYIIEVSLFDDVPFGATIQIGYDRVEDDRKIVMPTVPEKVLVGGYVEVASLKRAAGASMSLVSSFPANQGQVMLNDLDWCRGKQLGDMRSAFRCQCEVDTTTDNDGSFSVQLLPGTYNVYTSPSRENPNSRGALTSATTLTVETQAGGMQLGQLVRLGKALDLRGSVYGLNGEPLSDVIMTLLPLHGPGDAGLYGYNRASDTITGSKGTFSLAIDRGYFDVVVRPPDASGYPWLYKANRVFNVDYTIGSIVMPPPVVWQGMVMSGSSRIGGAQVDAYALVHDLSRPGHLHGVLIGSTKADINGQYVLRLPPSVLDTE